MRLRPLVLCPVFLTAALAVAGCSSGGTPAPAATSSRPAVGTAAGTVTVTDGGKVVCVMTIKDGKGSCKVSTKNYAPGTVKFNASYGGSKGFKPSHSTVSLQLVKG